MTATLIAYPTGTSVATAVNSVTIAISPTIEITGSIIEAAVNSLSVFTWSAVDDTTTGGDTWTDVDDSTTGGDTWTPVDDSTTGGDEWQEVA